MKKKKPLSIRDIAKKAGYSTATVSRVINNQGGYSEATKKAVHEAIQKTGYSTGSNTSKRIGILVPDLSNEWFAQLCVALEKYLFEYGYSAFICNANEDSKRENFYFMEFNNCKVAAMICFVGSKALGTLAAGANFPVVFIDRVPIDTEQFICLESDNYLGGYMATELLIHKGCKRIMLLGWERPLSVNLERQQGYLDALKDHNIAVDKELMVELSDESDHYEGARHLVSYLANKSLNFDGVFATNDLRAYGALQALQQNGIDVPGKVKIIGYDDSAVSQRCYPALTTVHQDCNQMAKKAVEILMNRIEDAASGGSEHIVLPVSVIERGTT
ncbi:HTH-type transcriptional regulator GalR [Caprobacter fermentans]|uniref:HTH-type transcriptional regulator GalR n=1 Tax=Caproicibacter fermentans TaxID=2576756 RepID=A0A6N8I0M8_9FIRM|nr:LacI family DNA-binding transcriptional regulator [Caproicibacter fermentans]MVB11509.1 HTH-type transcriptional regulator GalR [Caproicibacter fermentans]OCN02706.1 hypothetical protein A7X67_14135 [Clostridium sp. W14A]